MAARLHKGDRVYVEGKLKLNAWTDKDGKERSGLQVASFRVAPLGQIGRKRPANAAASSQPSTGRKTTAQAKRNYAAPNHLTRDPVSHTPLPAHMQEIPF